MLHKKFIFHFLLFLILTQNGIGQYAPIFNESDLYTDLPFKMEKVKQTNFAENTVNIKDFGAVCNGITSNTKAIAKAIDAAALKGGGTVIIPEGLWLTGPIILKSNINLHAEKGALVRFTSDYSEYPLVKTWYEGESTWRAMSPIYAEGAENIAITGEGIFDGNGDAWRPLRKNNIIENRWKRYVLSGGVINKENTAWYPTEGSAKGNSKMTHTGEWTKEECEEIKVALRPVLLSLVKCKIILIDGVTFQNPPAWTLHPLLSEDIIIRNIKVYNEEWQTNADALDLESCRNTLIYNCTFDAGDDAICMKSGKDEEGRKRGVSTENVIISNCSVYKGHGGFVIGSEMSGGVRNIKVSHCTFMGTQNGLRFKSTRGRGGIVENIYISDINMVDMMRDAIVYDLYYATKENKSAPAPIADISTPQFKNIHMKNIYCKGADRAILFQGLPEMNLENVTLENTVIEARTGVFCNDINNISMKNVQIISKTFPVINMQNARNMKIENFKCDKNQPSLIKISGKKSENILLLNTDLNSTSLELSEDVKENVVKFQ